MLRTMMTDVPVGRAEIDEAYQTYLRAMRAHARALASVGDGLALEPATLASWNGSARASPVRRISKKSETPFCSRRP